jgi:tRNA (cytidine/uridine-2'-O-)-methyltransferase
MEDRELKRAGLDYHEYATVRIHRDWPSAQREFAGQRVFAFSTRADARYDRVNFQSGDVFVFGPETRGLPAHVLEGFVPARRLRLPLVAGNRSLNLSNSVAVVVYEAWRQNGFAGGG